MPRPRWSMVISHHPPSQYERTLHLGAVRVCARCSAIVAGIIGCCIASWAGWHLDPRWALAIGSMTILCGIATFVLNEVGKRKSSNWERMGFGVALGIALVATWLSSGFEFHALIALIVVGQFASASCLQRHGVLDRFVNDYLGRRDDERCRAYPGLVQPLFLPMRGSAGWDSANEFSAGRIRKCSWARKNPGSLGHARGDRQ